MDWKGNRTRVVAGALAILFFTVHAVSLIVHGEPYHLLWACHSGCLLLGLGFLSSRPWLASVGLLWLLLGLPLWAIGLFTDSSYVLTSVLTHLGGPLVGIIGIRTLTVPRYSWLAASVSLLLLWVVTRVVTPPAANVNLAFKVWAGWETVFRSHAVYLLFLFVSATGFFFVIEKAALSARRR